MVVESFRYEPTTSTVRNESKPAVNQVVSFFRELRLSPDLLVDGLIDQEIESLSPG